MTNHSEKKLIVFGARGRVGRAVAAEARARGYEVTEAGRADGDVTREADVARLAAGHDAAVVAVYDAQAAPGVSSRRGARAGGGTPAGGGAAAGGGRAGLRTAHRIGYAADGHAGISAGVAGVLRRPRGRDRRAAGAGSGGAGLGGAEPGRDFAGDGAPAAAGHAVPAPADAASRITHAGFARAVMDEAGPAATLHAVHAGVGPA
ncbi:hypothetical protein WKI68_26210 [Streptomyces sp. MS1.HAVA.3]|uniref:NAD(P)-binding domain-containing protein n=1 Tax=Streptomyces caledonius TaxID=3134107 RepID=A0ABU8U7Q9_9ACTN